MLPRWGLARGAPAPAIERSKQNWHYDERAMIKKALETLFSGKSLQRERCEALFTDVLSGRLDEINLTALLVALKCKGEAPDEIAGAATAMRQAATPFPRGELPVADSCGTGGDGTGTVNISTAVALVAAEAGLRVVKHGNRSVSSRCGSADVLEAAGVAIDTEVALASRCLEELSICFLFAPRYHSAMRHAMPVRRALATRTIFNLLGPLANPAAPEVQLVGVYDPALCAPLAATLGLLGCKEALVVHGSGLDEIALHGPTHAVHLVAGRLETLELSPAAVGLDVHPLDALRGGNAEDNAQWLHSLLAGEASEASSQAVAFNAGALLWIGGLAPDLVAGVALARELIGAGRCRERLVRWGELSHVGD